MEKEKVKILHEGNKASELCLKYQKHCVSTDASKLASREASYKGMDVCHEA